MRKREEATLVPGLGDMPTVARATESAGVAFVLLGLAAASKDTGFTSEPVMCSKKAASGPATLPVLLGHLESQLPALPTLWNRPGKPHQTSIGSQPGMMRCSSQGSLLAGIFLGTALSHKYFLQKTFETGKPSFL